MGFVNGGGGSCLDYQERKSREDPKPSHSEASREGASKGALTSNKLVQAVNGGGTQLCPLTPSLPKKKK